MDPTFWLERWQKSEIGFHAKDVQPALEKHWSALKIAVGARVLVPLCGKSLDMLWLAEQGYQVVGAELSELAVDAFFAERGLMPTVRIVDEFTVKSAGPYEIWCGDFLALKREHMNAAAAYDRAALVAMPPAMQAKYSGKLAELMPFQSQILLIGLDYDRNEMQGPPFAIPRISVQTLFEDDFNVTLLEARDGMAKSEHLAKRGVTRLEEAAYLLRRRL